jgi:hypothetical protein
VLANEACLAELLDMADDGKAAHHACLRHFSRLMSSKCAKRECHRHAS